MLENMKKGLGKHDTMHEELNHKEMVYTIYCELFEKNMNNIY